MADASSQIYIQTVFAVPNRQALIRPEWEESLYKYATGIIQNCENKLLCIGRMPDHIHIFIGLKPAESLSGAVCKYILNQKEHHRRITFEAEFSA